MNFNILLICLLNWFLLIFLPNLKNILLSFCIQIDIEALNHQMHDHILSRNKEAETEKYFGKVHFYVYFTI